MNKEKSCVECKKKVRNTVSELICRKCWLNIRDKEDRCFDFLFCKDKREMKKTKVFTPVEETVVDIAGNIIDKDIKEKEC